MSLAIITAAACEIISASPISLVEASRGLRKYIAKVPTVLLAFVMGNDQHPRKLYSLARKTQGFHRGSTNTSRVSTGSPVGTASPQASESVPTLNPSI